MSGDLGQVRHAINYTNAPVIISITLKRPIKEGVSSRVTVKRPIKEGGLVTRHSKEAHKGGGSRHASQ